jgi:hypothetical protein
VEDYYSFDCGNSHFVNLDSTQDPYGDQMRWLESDLQLASQDPRIVWIFAAFHHPPYSAGNHGSTLRIREAWCPLFEEYGVDIVFSGHDHDYERTWSINGVVYIVSGGGGAPLRAVGDSLWTAYSDSVYHFCRISIDDRTLQMHAISPDGQAFDSLRIDKPPAGLAESVSPVSREPGLRAFPVPFSDLLTIDLMLTEEGEAELILFDQTGRLVDALYPGLMQAGSHTLVWSPGSGNQLPAGIYMLVLRSGEGICSTRLVRTSD